MDSIEIHLSSGKVFNAAIDERVYADLTCGQYESGWAVYDPTVDFSDCVFVSESGDVYAWGTDVMIGRAPGIEESFLKREEMD